MVGPTVFPSAKEDPFVLAFDNFLNSKEPPVRIGGKVTHGGTDENMVPGSLESRTINGWRIIQCSSFMVLRCCMFDYLREHKHGAAWFCFKRSVFEEELPGCRGTT